MAADFSQIRMGFAFFYRISIRVEWIPYPRDWKYCVEGEQNEAICPNYFFHNSSQDIVLKRDDFLPGVLIIEGEVLSIWGV